MRNLPHHFNGFPSTRRLREASGRSIRLIVTLPARFLIGLITLYQHTLSPDHGPLRHLHSYGYCRHSPTCSVYARRMIAERGALVGGLLACRRVLGCHPWKKLDERRIMKISHSS